MADDTLMPARAMFRFEVPCLKVAGAWKATGLELPAEHRLPNLGAIEERPEWADVRVGWNERGLYFAAAVTGKEKSPWCRATRAGDSDGLHVWIDTRDTHNVHRASRFCHWFALLPAGGGQQFAEPVAGLMLINRARENPKHIPSAAVKIRGAVVKGGYSLSAFIPAEALTGFDPDEHPKLGFTYAVRDSELGEQTFSCPAALPYPEDPSLWATLDLTP